MKRPVYACLNMAVIVAALALAGPANAANVFVEVIDFGQVGCDATYRTTIDARPGDQNNVSMRDAPGLSAPAPVGGCGDHVQVLSTEADRVRRGDGADTVIAGPGDFVDGDCEQVHRLG